MRALQIEDLAGVSGGSWPLTVTETLTVAGAVGSGVGSAAVLNVGGGLTGIAATSGAGAATTVAGGMLLGPAGAAIAGWAAGTAIHEALPDSVNDAIGASIAGVLDRIGNLFQSSDTAEGGRSPFMCYMDDANAFLNGQ